MIKNKLPFIFTIISAVGVVATTVCAVKDTMKANDVISECKKEDKTIYEKFKSLAPLYLPTVVLGSATILCIFSSNALSQKQQASIVSAYALLNESFNKYRKSAKKIYGEDADARIIEEAARDTYVSARGISIYEPDMIEEEDIRLFYDLYSGRYFRTTLNSVLNAQYHVNRNLVLRGIVTYNEFNEFLGISKVEGGDEIGWNYDNLMEGGYAWLDFDNRYCKVGDEPDDELGCYVISYIFTPEPFEDCED